MLDVIKHDNEIIAIVLRGDYSREGVDFLTPNDLSLQLAYMNRPDRDVIPAHYHKENKRIIMNTQEVLIIRKGKMKVDLYTPEQVHMKTIELASGDLILLASGGHRFEMLEKTEFVEVKQGPYVDKDKDKHIFE